MPHGLHLGYLLQLRQLTLLKHAVYGLQASPGSCARTLTMDLPLMPAVWQCLSTLPDLCLVHRRCNWFSASRLWTPATDDLSSHASRQACTAPSTADPTAQPALPVVTTISAQPALVFCC